MGDRVEDERRTLVGRRHGGSIRAWDGALEKYTSRMKP